MLFLYTENKSKFTQGHIYVIIIIICSLIMFLTRQALHQQFDQLTIHSFQLHNLNKQKVKMLQVFLSFSSD